MIRRGLTFVLAPALALGPAAPAPAFAGDLKEVESSMSARELCANLLQISLRKLGKLDSAADRSDVHARMQAGMPMAKGMPQVVIKALIGGGMGAYGPAGPESVVAWRDASGNWHAQRAEETRPGIGMEPEPPLAPLWPDPAPKPAVDGHVPAPGGLSLSAGPIPPQHAAALNRALSPESCINVEPPSFPASLPLRRGGSAPCVPDSAWRHIEIRQENEVRRFTRPCQSIGPVGLIGRTLDGMDLPAAPVVRRKADLYNGTDMPSRSSLLAFLDARLPGVRYRYPGGEDVITAIRHVAPCASSLSLRKADGTSREVEVIWTAPRSFSMWISDGVVPLGEGGRDPSWIAPGTTLALQLQGALYHLSNLCAT